jgi:tRNA(adenine34) deaminase
MDEVSLKDIQYMNLAIEEAYKAKAILEVPIGAILVYQDKVIGRGYNRRNTDKSTFAHAEILAMQEAMDFIGDWRLEETTLYVTLEPCPMCAGAIVQARIPRVVIGAMNPKAGSAGSVINILNEPGFNHQVEVNQGVCETECKDMLQQFFRELRELKKQ